MQFCCLDTMKAFLISRLCHLLEFCCCICLSKLPLWVTCWISHLQVYCACFSWNLWRFFVIHFCRILPWGHAMAFRPNNKESFMFPPADWRFKPAAWTLMKICLYNVSYSSLEFSQCIRNSLILYCFTWLVIWKPPSQTTFLPNMPRTYEVGLQHIHILLLFLGQMYENWLS